jgi:hypothetical protein
MRSSALVLEPQLAWALWHGLAKLSNLLWERDEEDFSKLAEEERVRRGKVPEEDLEIEIPF